MSLAERLFYIMAATDVPEGVILIWPGTDAGVPAGWVRETDLDGKFPKATADLVDPAVTGGADTHTHTSPVHTHSAVAHRHFGQTMQQTSAIGEDTGGGDPSTDASHDDHYHNYDFTNITGGSLSDAITYLSGDSRPPYYEVIFIKPDGAPAGPPDGVIALFDRSAIPTDWNICDGNNSTPNLHNKYLRGAGTGLDAGSTGGGLTHTHSVNHTHSSVNHSHAGLSQHDGNADRRRNSAGSGGSVVPRHQHTITLSDVADAGSAYTGTAGSAETVEPLHKKLLAIQNNTGGVDKPRFIIGLWLGLLADIPAGWELCDGDNGTVDLRGYHLKLTINTTEIGTIGGSNTHSHAPSNSHSHTSAIGAHTHTGSTDTYVAYGSTGSGSPLGAKSHNHPTMTSVSSAVTSWLDATIQANSSNNEPAFTTVAFIQFTGEPVAEQISAQIIGAEDEFSTRGAEIIGIDPAEQRNCQIIGREILSSERGAEISAMIRWVIDPKPDLEDYTV